MTKQEIIKRLQAIVDYPPEGHSRRTDDGYPLELEYDEFAYFRIIDSYRDALKEIIKDIGDPKEEKQELFAELGKVCCEYGSLGFAGNGYFFCVNTRDDGKIYDSNSLLQDTIWDLMKKIEQLEKQSHIK